MPLGSAVFRTTDKRKAQRIVNIMKPIAKKKDSLSQALKNLVLDENEIDVDNMSDEEIIDWMVN